MPTPFYHLSLAEGLLDRSDLPEPIRVFLQNWCAEFLFGNTAPDVQVVSGQSRQVTHFFNLPIRAGDRVAWEQFFTQCPQLADAGLLPPRQAAFLAGFVCHLQADWWWAKDLFEPFFGPYAAWGTFKHRLYYHNVLRAYLDQHILPGLHAGMDICLSQVEPDDWLPFVRDRYLSEWRDLLYPQLKPGATIKTVEVFSSRQGISPPEYYALLGSDQRMQQEVFQHFPLELVNEYRQHVLMENIRLLSDYMAFSLHLSNTPSEENVTQGAVP